MKKQILEEEISRIKQVMGIIKEDSIKTDDDIMRTLKRQVLGIKGNNGKDVVVDLIDKREGGVRKNIIMRYDENGELVDTSVVNKETEISEDFKDKVKVFLACTILATGAVSCTKQNDGFGYNVGSRATEYTLDAGTPNKKITISTPMGDEEHEVDSTLGDTKYYSSGQGLKVGRPLTPTEERIVKMGHAYQTEKNMNNKRGTPENKRWDYNPEMSTVTGGGGYYEDEPFEHKTIRTHPLWKMGLEMATKEGLDVESLLQQADDEVRNGNYIK